MDLNASQAALRAGYSARTAPQQGSRLLKNVDVQAAIATQQAQQLERFEVRIEDVPRDLKAIAPHRRRLTGRLPERDKP